MVKKSLDGEDAVDVMNLLYAIRWSCEAWHEVTKETISNCWRVSNCLNVYSGPQLLNSDQNWTTIRDLCCQLERVGVIQQAMDISHFINPSEEAITDVEPAAIIEHVVELFTPIEEELEEQPVPQPVTHKEAYKLVETLLVYELAQQEHSQSNYKAVLEAMGRSIAHRDVAETLRSKKQASILSFLC